MSENHNPAPGRAGPDQPDPLPPGLGLLVTAGARPLTAPPLRGARPNRGLAVVSVILGAVALPLDVIVGAGFFFAIPAIILSSAALRRIRQSKEKGQGLAIAGLIAGCVAAALAVFAFYFELSQLAAECARDGGC